MIYKAGKPESFFKKSEFYYTGKREYLEYYGGSSNDPIHGITFWGWIIRIIMIGIPTAFCIWVISLG